jgi:hypothetical protein
MNAYETSATVEQHEELHLGGVPFPPGTQVEVIISPKGNGVQAPDVSQHVANLFAALDKARNVQPIGRFNRQELYDRDVLH